MALLREDQFQSFLARQRAKACGLLIYGDDPSGVDEIARVTLAAATKGDSSAITRLQASDLADDGARLMDEVQSMSLLGGDRAVLVEGASDAQLRILEPVLALSSVQNFLVITAGSLSKGSKLRAAFEGAANFFCLPLYEAKSEVLEQRVSGLLRSYGLGFADGASEVFFSLVGDGRGEVMREAEKLALYCTGQTQISEDDVRAVCGDIAQFSVDRLVDAVFAGDMQTSDRALQALENDGQRPILNALLFHVSRLQDLRLEMSQGGTIDSVIAAARPMIFFNRRRAVADQLRRLDFAALEEIGSLLSAALLQSRKLPDLAEAIINRSVLHTAYRVAQSKRS
jgi:DNA polymerase III subunit delta